MSYHANSSKHKAMHRGYKSNPTQQQVNALLGLYSGCNPQPKTRKIKQPIQLKIKFPI